MSMIITRTDTSNRNFLNFDPSCEIMNIPIPKISVLLLSGLFLITTSCDQEACFEETNAFLKASMYNYSTLKIKAPDSLSLFGLTKPEVKIYDKAKNITSTLMPLDCSKESCSYVIKINGVNDTITFIYTSSPHLISKSCGYTYYHTLNTAIDFSTNEIDSLGFTNNSITTFDAENIRIYY
jgi:hypothetical protein